VKVLPLEFPTGGALSTVLLELAVADASILEIGTARFPAGVRSPVHGLHMRDAHEITFILEGEFCTESGGESRTVRAGEVVSIPAGEANASQALTDGRVIYLMLKRKDPSA
jgi:uncharacterized cupin superfamily protein